MSTTEELSGGCVNDPEACVSTKEKCCFMNTRMFGLAEATYFQNKPSRVPLLFFRMHWKEVVTMAADVARNGFNVTHDLGKHDALLYFHFKPSNTIALPYVCSEAVLDS